jgi:hypothetical protein
MIQLLVPAEQYLPSYAETLRRGWLPNNERDLAASLEEREQIEANPAAFIASLDDREA